MPPLYIIGTGPGDIVHLTDAARQALAESTTIIGYDSYLEQISPLIAGKTTVATGMMREIERCREAIVRARAGEAVALVSGGDAGIYGMAGLVLELLENEAESGLPQPDVRVIPGISAIQAAASVLGAPLMHDFAVISLSDLLTPWDLIMTRLTAAARADFVIVIFNPRSTKRVTQIEEARRIILASRPAETPAGIVRNACRPDEQSTVTTLGALLEHRIDMSTIVVIGNSSSFVDSHGRMVTPRGYAGKYGAAPSSEPESVMPECRSGRESRGPHAARAAADQAPCRSSVGRSITSLHAKAEAFRPGGMEASRIQAETDTPAVSRPGALMFCGTASDVGKSVVTAGFCRLLVRCGIRTAPFKSQNMSLNSAVTPDGGEIGRAQAVQAQACRIDAHTDMNPVLLKPNSDTGSQVIVQGRPVGSMNVAQYDAYKPQAFARVAESFERLKGGYDFVAIEGAGSIAEINLKHNDIANLRVAAMARCPVILVADIDRGGVFAQIVGTIDLLEPHEKAMIRGIIINRFRGDAAILRPGLDFITERTGIPVIGVLPWLADLNLPAEDSMALSRPSHPTGGAPDPNTIRIGVVRLPRISNFTDFDAFSYEPDCTLTYLESPQQMAGLDVLILPGSKTTIPDLNYLKERGFFEAIEDFTGQIVGICGGYQMLGQRVSDPDGVESDVRELAGLGLLPVETELLPKKSTHQAAARLDDAGQALAPGCEEELAGYEIHMGITTPVGPGRPFARISRRGAAQVAVPDGAVSPDARIFGTYLHGIFDNARFRKAYLNRIRSDKGLPVRHDAHEPDRGDPFDRLADHLERHLDIPLLLHMCGLER
ncbi:cobyric acid synthase [Oryzomonas japonica]|uniref:Cobyric acid synthase n=1 Tax=Oryzomonas japonica TaxID=2603858 RepID=A0A7J4ZS67_9BACT|nr:cobyric acid synthase [Oryzomonas japonica]KAB0666124.1 cobyric acid synthase [Oryzomonas japonica]